MSVDIERETIYEHDRKVAPGFGDSSREVLKIVSTDDPRHPIEIHCTEYRDAHRERGVAVYLSPEMIRAIKESDVLVATTCTRPKHTESPCNGYPRPDCPGYEEWNGLP